MENFQIEYKLSLYEKLTVFSKTEKATVELVQNSLDGRIYVRKILKNYNVEVYNLLQQVDSVFIPKIYEVLEYKNTLTIIEEFINGATLQDILEKDGQIDHDTVVKYAIVLCEALSVIHNIDKPIIHRDIKPSNIIIDNYGVLKLIDFDASRVYKKTSKRDTQILGTEGYAAPEQFGFLQTDCKSDIYAIGILMNILITGKHPREEEVTGELRKIIAKCIEINPEHRYRDTLELRRNLLKIINKSVVSNENTIRFEIPDMFKKRDNVDYIKNERILSNESSQGDKIRVNLNKTTSETKSVKKKERPKLLKWLDVVPGYRTRNEFKEILATCSYVFLIFMLFMPTVDAEKIDIYTFLENLSMVSAIIGIIFVWTNFKDIHRYLPILNSENKSINKLGCFIYSFIIFFIGGAFLSYFMAK